MFNGADFLAAHNASFDSGVLQACCRRYGLAIPGLPFQCSMQIARRTWGIYPTKLSDVCRNLRIKFNHHEALSDATACAKIVITSYKEKQKSKTIIRRRSVEQQRVSM
jgi:DNA polymerase III subunit epsilon